MFFSDLFLKKIRDTIGRFATVRCDSALHVGWKLYATSTLSVFLGWLRFLPVWMVQPFFPSAKNFLPRATVR